MNESASEATEELFELYSDDVYRYALFVLGNPSDAQDVVQEVFIRVFNSWGKFRHESSVRTWIWSITRNYILDIQRKRKWRTVSLDVDAVGLPVISMNEIVEWEDILRQLSPSYRQVIYWRIIEDLSVLDTAEILGWTQNKVRVTLHRAIRCLQRAFPTARVLHEEGSETHGFQRR